MICVHLFADFPNWIFKVLSSNQNNSMKRKKNHKNLGVPGVFPSKMHKIVLGIVSMLSVDQTVLFIPFCQGKKLSLKELKQHAKNYKILVGWNFGLLETGISHKRRHNLIYWIIELGYTDGVSGRNPEHLQVGYLFFLTDTSMQSMPPFQGRGK